MRSLGLCDGHHRIIGSPRISSHRSESIRGSSKRECNRTKSLLKVSQLRVRHDFFQLFLICIAYTKILFLKKQRERPPPLGFLHDSNSPAAFPERSNRTCSGVRL